MFIHDVNHWDFIQVLGALPSAPAVTRAHILGAFDLIVTSDDPREWWHRLELDRGEAGAAKAVAQLVISHGGKRVLALIRAEVADRSIPARADDSKLVRLLFDESMEDTLCVAPPERAIVFGDREIGEAVGLVASGVRQRVVADRGLVVAELDGLARVDCGPGR